MPGLVSQAPDPDALPVDLGRAVFTELDAQALSTPGALGPLGSIVTGPDGVSALPADAQRNVLEWVEAGGQLIVDAPPGSPIVGVPPEWQPAGARAAAGAGWVRSRIGARPAPSTAGTASVLNGSANPTTSSTSTAATAPVTAAIPSRRRRSSSRHAATSPATPTSVASHSNDPAIPPHSAAAR